MEKSPKPISKKQLKRFCFTYPFIYANKAKIWQFEFPTKLLSPPLLNEKSIELVKFFCEHNLPQISSKEDSAKYLTELTYLKHIEISIALSASREKANQVINFLDHFYIDETKRLEDTEELMVKLTLYLDTVYFKTMSKEYSLRSPYTTGLGHRIYISLENEIFDKSSLGKYGRLEEFRNKHTPKEHENIGIILQQIKDLYLYWHSYFAVIFAPKKRAAEYCANIHRGLNILQGELALRLKTEYPKNGNNRAKNTYLRETRKDYVFLEGSFLDLQPFAQLINDEFGISLPSEKVEVRV